MNRIAIEQIGYVGNLGDQWVQVLDAMEAEHRFVHEFDDLPVGKVTQPEFTAFSPGFKGYHRLDRTAQQAIYAAEQLKHSELYEKRLMVAIGSSRGATSLWEQAHSGFMENGSCAVLDSPLTTAGNLSSNVGNYLKAGHFIDVEQSITCASGLRALADACAWIDAGFVDGAIAGGSEAPLTPFTIAQMDALGILSRYPQEFCRALDRNKERNTMVLGEGAVLFALSKRNEKAMAYIAGIGFATEEGNSATGMSPEGSGFQSTMQQAVRMAGWERPDAIVAHAPGTIVGDNAELFAIERCFGEIPVTSTKHRTGHMFGASGPMSVLMAVAMMKEQRWVTPAWVEGPEPAKLKKIIVNAIGFGANAISLAVELD